MPVHSCNRQAGCWHAGLLVPSVSADFTGQANVVGQSTRVQLVPARMASDILQSHPTRKVAAKAAMPSWPCAQYLNMLQATAKLRSVYVQLVVEQLDQCEICEFERIQPNTCSIWTPTQRIMTPSPAVCVRTPNPTRPRRPLLVTTLCARAETITPGRPSACIS